MTELTIQQRSSTNLPTVHLDAQLFETMVFEHLFSDPSADVARDAHRAGTPAKQAGQTDWTSRHAGRSLSLCWDWIELHDGDLRPLRIVAPRANFRLVCAQGKEFAPEVQTAMLWELIDKQRWRNEVRAALHEWPLRASGTHEVSLQLH